MRLWLFTHADTDGWKVNELVRTTLFEQKNPTRTYQLVNLPLKTLYFKDSVDWADQFDAYMKVDAEDKISPDGPDYEISNSDFVIFADIGPCADKDLMLVKKVAGLAKKTLVVEGFNHPIPGKFIADMRRVGIRVYYCAEPTTEDSLYGHEAYETYRMYRKEIKEDLSELIESLPTRKYKPK